jgi:two-component system OmpR family sensor kinase
MAFWGQSIRVKLTVWYTVLVLSSILLFGGTSYYVTKRTLSENLDISLKNDVRWVRELIQPKASKVKPSKQSIDALLSRRAQKQPRLNPAPEDTTGEEADEIWNEIFRHTLQSRQKTYIQIADDRGTIIHRSYNLGLDSLAVRDTIPLNQTIVTTGWLNAEPIRIAASRDRHFVFFVGYPIAELNDLLESLYLVFLILIPIALAVSIIGGLALAHKSLHPVDEITRRARRITAENLDQTLPVRPVDDEISRLSSTFNEMIERLKESFAQVRQFSGDASHELRTPLTIMRGEIELALRSNKAPEEYRRVLQSSLEEILRMSSIIENLLMLAKADQGSYHAEFSEIDLKALVEELFEDSEALAEHKRIHVTLKNVAPITIVGDRVRLRQLFLNLIDNAIKYTPEGGSVALTVQQQNGSAVFQVEDTGIGIPKEEQGKIFDRFYRVDKARSREAGGSGLGLSIAKWIAELHRGTIEVESELSRGSVFTVHLPLN